MPESGVAPRRRPLRAEQLLLLLLTAGPGPAARAADDPQLLRGRELFTGKANPPCAVCHTLAAAGSSGDIGPVLDELKPDADRVRRALQSGLGIMPSYAGKLDAADLEALAQFVSRASGGVKP